MKGSTLEAHEDVAQEEVWLRAIGITEIHLGTEKHDGFIDIQLSTTLSHDGEAATSQHLSNRVRNVDSAVGTDKNIKVIASPKTDHSQMTYDELRKLAHSAIRSINAWARNCDPVDIQRYKADGDLVKRLMLEAMAYDVTSLAPSDGFHS